MTIFHERNDLVLFILSVTHGGYNMNIRWNQKFIDRGINFSVCLCRGYVRDMCAQHFWESPLYHPALLEIPTLPPAGRKRDAFQRSNHYQKPNFRCRHDKKILFLIYFIRIMTCRQYFFLLTCKLVHDIFLMNRN